MFFELGLEFLLYKTYKFFKYKNIRQFNNKFQDILYNAGLKNVDGQTFLATKINDTKYGQSVYIKALKGKSFKDLIDKKEILQDNMNCVIEFEKEKFQEELYMRIINKDINEKMFKSIKVKPYELFLGFKMNGEPYILDLRKDPHILISGATGTGKSFLLASLLVNSLYYNSKTIDVHLLQIVKGEIEIFRKCKSVKSVCNDLKKCADLLERIARKVDIRSRKFTQYGIKDIKQWNEIVDNKDKLRYNYIIIDEMSFFIENDSDSDKIKILKQKCLNSLLIIAKAGRSSGVYLIGLLQRCTYTNINTDLRSQMTRISFRQKSEADSKLIINTKDAKDLGEREFIVDSNTEYITLKAPLLDKNFLILQKYIPEIIIPNKNKIKKSLEKKSNKQFLYNNSNLEKRLKESKNLCESHQQFTIDEWDNFKRKERSENIISLRQNQNNDKRAVVSIDEVKKHAKNSK